MIKQIWAGVFMGVVVTALIAAEPVKSQLPANKTWKMVWHDEFDGTELDRTKWDFRLHIMQTRHQTFTNAGARVENGLLYLDLIEQFLLVSTECEGYRKGSRDQPSARLKTAVLPDAFVVDYVRVYDEE
jgi:beta-glucanase (GH16 family)